jgi:hypothetical protein
VPVLEELVVVVLVSPGDGGECVQGAEVLQRFGVGTGEVASVPVEECVLEVGAGWAYAEAEPYEIAEWEGGRCGRAQSQRGRGLRLG